MREYILWYSYLPARVSICILYILKCGNIPIVCYINWGLLSISDFHLALNVVACVPLCISVYGYFCILVARHMLLIRIFGSVPFYAFILISNSGFIPYLRASVQARKNTFLVDACVFCKVVHAYPCVGLHEHLVYNNWV